MQDFYIENTIFYHDTDAGGVVYYGRYFEHLEESRYAYCKSRGIELSALIARGFQFPVVHTEVEYKAPARYADTIRISTRVEKIGTSSIHFYQEITRGTLVLVQAKTVWACIDSNFHTCPVPGDVRSALI